jgi:hypothetical protein
MELRASRHFTGRSASGICHGVLLDHRGCVMNITAAIHRIDRKLSREVAAARPALDRRLAISTAAAHRTSHPAEDSCGVELGDLLSMAVELNRNAAQQRNVRIHCHVLDQSLELERKDVLLAKLDLLLGRAIQRAHWGSIITCQAGLGNGEARFYVRFAVPAFAERRSTPAIDWVDELWSWSLSQTAAHMQ